MKRVSVLPTLLTLGNTFCGFLAISKIGDALAVAGDPVAFQGKIHTAAILIFLAMVFDALDGRVARMTHASTDFGAQLDSLTDLVTFGVVPAFMVKALCEQTLAAAGIAFPAKLMVLLTVLYVICAALRLARFTLETNPDPEAHDRFRGLPSPAAAGVVASAVLFYLRVMLTDGDQALAEPGPWGLAFIRGLPFALPFLGLMMVSPVAYTHIVNRYLRGRQPFFYVVQVVFLILLLVLFYEWVFFASFSLYALAGPISHVIGMVRGPKKKTESTISDEQSPFVGTPD